VSYGDANAPTAKKGISSVGTPCALRFLCGKEFGQTVYYLFIYDSLNDVVSSLDYRRTLISISKQRTDPLKKKRICFVQALGTYRAVNTLHLGYTNPIC
jgi:hypothetical protein